ncbi:hypothetical protein [uncultured Helicobacter sp.]
MRFSSVGASEMPLGDGVDFINQTRFSFGDLLSLVSRLIAPS